MVFQPVPNTVKLELVYNVSDSVAENVLHFRRATPYSQEDLDELVDTAASTVTAEFLPIMNDDVTFNRAQAVGLTLENDVFAVQLGAPTDVGAVASPQAANVTKAITFRTGLTGRSARGRAYMVGLALSQLVDSNTVSDAYITAAIAAWIDLKNNAAAIGWTHVVVSRVSNGIARPTGMTFPVTSYGVSNTSVDSMRGRLD